MGGEVVVFKNLKHWRTKFPLAWVVDLGPWLRSEYIKREVRCGWYFIDFGNDILRGIEIDGAAFHQNKAREIERDEYLESCGWLVFHIKASRLWRDPDVVSNQTRLFLWEGRTAAKRSPRRGRRAVAGSKWGV